MAPDESYGPENYQLSTTSTVSLCLLCAITRYAVIQCMPRAYIVVLWQWYHCPISLSLFLMCFQATIITLLWFLCYIYMELNILL